MYLAFVQTDFTGERSVGCRGSEIDNQVAYRLVASEVIGSSIGTVFTIIALVAFGVDDSGILSARPEGDFVQRIAVSSASVKDGGSDTAIADGIGFAFPKAGRVGVLATGEAVGLFVQVVDSFAFEPSFGRCGRMFDTGKMGQCIAFPKSVADIGCLLVFILIFMRVMVCVLLKFIVRN